ncbi:MAG: hypothetical protein ACI4MU_01750 [Candidatus Ventricola sp.]
MGAPRTADELRAVGGFSFYLILLEKFPLRGLCGMDQGAGFCYMFISSFSDYQTNYHKSYHIDLKTPPIRLPAAMTLFSL